MDFRLKRRNEMYWRVYLWLAGKPELLAAMPLLETQIVALHDVIVEMDAAATGQERQFLSSQGSTAEAVQLRRVLVVKHMRPIARVAKLVIPDVAKMTVALRMPGKKIDAAGLFTSAQAMAGAAESYQEVLVKKALPADFVSRLRTAAGNYRDAIHTRGQSQAHRRGATESLEVLSGQARKNVDTISEIVTRALSEDRAALAEWMKVKRVTLKGVPSTEPSPEAGALPESPAVPVTGSGSASGAQDTPAVTAGAAQQKAV